MMLLPLIFTVKPEVIAAELLRVQPLTAPTNLPLIFRTRYDLPKYPVHEALLNSLKF